MPGDRTLVRRKLALLKISSQLRPISRALGAAGFSKVAAKVKKIADFAHEVGNRSAGQPRKQK